MLRFKAKMTLNKTEIKTAKKKCFLVSSTKSEKIAIQQSHIINPLLTSFAWSVRESNAFGFYRTDLAPSSLGLYENLRQYFPIQTSHSVNKSLILNNIVAPKSRVTILNNIVDNCKQCGQHNTVQFCFQQYCNKLMIFFGV